jgi:hypothetical protein
MAQKTFTVEIQTRVRRMWAMRTGNQLARIGLPRLGLLVAKWGRVECRQKGGQWKRVEVLK